MVSRLDWRACFRIIPSLYPAVGIFDDVSDPHDLEAVFALEAATNPRILAEAGELALVRPEERISGEGATPIMAAFTHAKPSRFSDGTYGVYYSAHDQETAIAETAYHRLRFITDAGLRSEIVHMRVYSAHVRGSFDDIRPRGPRSKVYDPDSYAFSQQYARKIFDANKLDGIVFRSVRRPAGECVAVFRPRRISEVRVVRHLQYRFEEGRFLGAMEIAPA
ncbi:MAG: RES family NAD+ phosphorylase [Candidatus Eremiobacteraeota bacterium]|nr:RES family NAD+ phosphorylase [Candidatus Eremiobacteraeota bacterium]